MREERATVKLPMVEIFETVEGEGTKAGHPTTFVRVYNCNLRCTWCDTPYSYAPAKPEFFATVAEIAAKVESYGNKYVCLTGGEPLMHGDKSLKLVQALASLPEIEDVHIETNGAIDLLPFARLREEDVHVRKKVRFILDYKLPASGEQEKMIHGNFALLSEKDEIKFVIADENDFLVAVDVLERWHRKGQPLFSPVWSTMPPERLVALLLKHKRTKRKLLDVKLNMQLHKIIWDPDRRGV
ncbi:putative 7-carboxy-7-deazaguanine synthase QueE [Bacillaceae bacterium]